MWIIGIGVPQNRWREMSQSRRRYDFAARPVPAAASCSMMRAIALRLESPSSEPELIIRPSPVSAMPVVAGSRSVERCLVGARIDRHAVVVELDHRDRAGDRRGGVDDDLDRQVEGAGEVEVALVVRGHGHDGAVAVVGEHVVGGPDRQPLAVDRVDRVALEEDAGLRTVGALALDVGLALDALEVVLEAHAHLGRRARGELGGQVAVGRDDEEGRAVQRVGARREDRDLCSSRPSISKSMSAPTERPIQLRCIRMTFCGQNPSSWFRSSSSRSA